MFRINKKMKTVKIIQLLSKVSILTGVAFFSPWFVVPAYFLLEILTETIEREKSTPNVNPYHRDPIWKHETKEVLTNKTQNESFIEGKEGQKRPKKKGMKFPNDRSRERQRKPREKREQQN